MAFAASFYACFGSDIASYRTFGSACLSMLKALMGNSDDLVDIPNAGFPIIGPLLIGSYSTCMYFILVNLFVAVLVDSFAATKLAWKIHEENEISKKHAAQQKIVSDLRTTFERDLADDDVIDREELEAIVRSYKDVLGFDTVDEFLNRYDENNDGEITRAELIPVLEKLDSDLAAIKNDGTLGVLTGQGMLEIFETFDHSMNDKFSAYTETLMRMIEQRSFGGGSSAAMGMGFEGGQGIIPVQRSRDVLSQDNLVASLIGTVKAKSQFMSIKNRCFVHADFFTFFI
jgi:Ca2+-binding EF-hand superfamily protein